MGLVLQARTPAGHLCYGEAAPLPGFSEETFEEAQAQLEGLLKNDSISKFNDGLDALGKDFDALGLMPSRFVTALKNYGWTGWDLKPI